VELVLRSIAYIDVSFLVLTLYFRTRDKQRERLMKLFKFLFSEILTACFGIVFISIVVPLITPIFLFYYIKAEKTKQYFRKKYGEMSLVDALDTVWGHINPKSPPYINVAMVIENQPCRETVINRIKEVILEPKNAEGGPLYWKFQSIIKEEKGYFVWVKSEKFDIENHVRYWDDNEPNAPDSIDDETDQSIDEQIEQNSLISRFMNDQGFSIIDPVTPQWEIVLLRSPRISKRMHVAVVRMNHSLGDGTSLMRLILAKMIDNPILVQPKGRPKLPAILRILATIRSFVLYPVDFIKFYRSSDRNPIHSSLNMTGKKICGISPSVSLGRMKEIKNAAGCTINDVFMTCFSGALTRTFKNRCEQSMTMMVPMSDHEYTEDFEPENKILFGLMTLPTVHDSMLTSKKRLRLCKDACDALKNSGSLIANNLAIRGALSVLPGATARQGTRVDGLSLGISNTPGPQQDIWLWGNRVVHMAYWVPDVEPVGAGVGMLSYCGQVRMTLMVDEGMEATQVEVQQLVKEFKNEADQLYREVVHPKK